MAGPRAVKTADAAPWIPLLSEYRLTVLRLDNVLQGTLLPHLDVASPEVKEALASWPGSAHLQSKDGVTQVVLVYQAREEERRWPWIHAALFALTVLTTLAAGALMAGTDPFATEVLLLGGVAIPYPSSVDWRTLALGAPFAIPFLGVLLAHEMGHYTAARIHRVRVSLPYFIPFPPYFSILGTIGAFIRLLGPTVRRATLFDVGSAGPIASFVVSLPLLVVGLRWSVPMPGPATVAAPFAIQFAHQTVWLGNSVVTNALAAWLAPVGVGDALLLLHPLALVGWLGLFVTTLNLLPLGQLDGGHIVYALAPEHHGPAARIFVLCLIPLGLLWWGWWAWAVVVVLVNRGRVGHPVVLQQEPEIGPLRRRLGWLLVLLFFITFVPVPLHL